MVSAPLCDVGIRYLALITLRGAYLMKKEWLVANITPVGSPDRVKRDISGIVFGIFWQALATFVVGEPLCDVGISPFEH